MKEEQKPAKQLRYIFCEKCRSLRIYKKYNKNKNIILCKCADCGYVWEKVPFDFDELEEIYNNS